MPNSVFALSTDEIYPFRFRGRLHVATIAGGVPSDPKVTEGWLRTKLADKDDIIRDLVAKTVLERGVTEDEAVQLVDEGRHLNGFKRDPRTGELYYEGRCLKAAIKEAAMVAANAGNLSTKNWGAPDNKTFLKGIKAWIPEHIFVVEDQLSLGVTEPTGIAQRFVHSRFGAAIQYDEYVEHADINFTVITDYDFKGSDWAALWLTAEQLGIGAARSQGFGRFVVTEWDRL
jgi:hypothetical protein